jgi:hypothetical protein
MKKALFTAVAAALTASACAQMPLPLADQSAPAPAQVPQLPASVERLTLIPFLGDLIGVMPRKATRQLPGHCPLPPADGGFRVFNKASVIADTKWEQDRLGAGQAICKATIRADQFAGLPRPGLKVYATAFRSAATTNRSSQTVEVRTVCNWQRVPDRALLASSSPAPAWTR